jgi:hypothetical protein
MEKKSEEYHGEFDYNYIVVIMMHENDKFNCFST